MRTWFIVRSHRQFGRIAETVDTAVAARDTTGQDRAMPSEPMSHPDRVAATFANVDAARAVRGDGPFAPPGPGAFDARIDL
jgi:hypothetical protein